MFVILKYATTPSRQNRIYMSVLVNVFIAWIISWSYAVVAHSLITIEIRVRSPVSYVGRSDRHPLHITPVTNDTLAPPSEPTSEIYISWNNLFLYPCKKRKKEKKKKKLNNTPIKKCKHAKNSWY